MLFSIKLSDALITDDIIEMKLEQAMLDCKLFADASISASSWRYKGNKIGMSYEGRCYMLDRLRFKIEVYNLLTNVGIKNFNIDISGSDFIITPKK